MVDKITGVVINKIVYDDNNEVVTVFTKELGKLAFYAMGVRKITSKNQYSIQFLSTSEFEVFLSYNDNKLSKLKTGNLIKSRFNLAHNYDDYLLATLICEITDQASEVRQTDEELYQLLTKTLDLLIVIEDNLIVVIYFMFLLLKWYGLAWNFTSCVRCKSSKNIKTISFAEEGFICKNCILKTDYIFSISLIKTISKWSITREEDFCFDKYLPLTELTILFKMLCEYYLAKIGIFSYSIYEMQKKSIYFK